MWTRRLGTLALCLVTTGCQLASNAVHNVTYEAQLKTAEIQERCNYEKLAQASWETVRNTDPCVEFSQDHAEGFKDGFVDYLEFGGSGRPPYVPPKRYWGPHYRTPEGYRAVEEWYAGFRQGVAAAQQSGYRQWVKLPSAHMTETPPLAPVPGDPPSPLPASVDIDAPVSAPRRSPAKLLPPVVETEPGEDLPSPPETHAHPAFQNENETD